VPPDPKKPLGEAIPPPKAPKDPNPAKPAEVPEAPRGGLKGEAVPLVALAPKGDGEIVPPKPPATPVPEPQAGPVEGTGKGFGVVVPPKEKRVIQKRLSVRVTVGVRVRP
jgi:hypothetical protein